MIEREAVAHCVRCKWTFQPRELRVGIKSASEDDPKRYQIFPSGCKCGPYRIEEVQKKR